jgi:hypothetical protein
MVTPLKLVRAHSSTKPLPGAVGSGPGVGNVGAGSSRVRVDGSIRGFTRLV